jgi:FtsP/CotA-like multicopper oxidase with cupredoxin domain
MRPRDVPLRRLDQRLYLALVLVFGVTAWEHVIHSFVLGEADTLSGHLTHILRDGMLALPLGVLALWVGAGLVARAWPRAEGRRSLLAMAAVTSVAYALLMIPSVGVHQQFDSHGAAGVAAGHAAHLAADSLESTSTLGGLALHGLRDAAIAEIVALPLLLIGLALLTGTALQRRHLRVGLPMRVRLALATAAATAFSMLSPFGTVTALAQTTSVSSPCTTSNTRTYTVSAINLKITVNRYGDNEANGFMYVLDSQINAVRAQEAAATVTPGLRKDAIQPLMLRGNLGECMKINFTNRLTAPPKGGPNPAGQTTQQGGIPPVSISPEGVAYDINNQGDAVGRNANSLVAPGASRTYTFYLDPALGEGGKIFHSGGDARELTVHGLFGAILAEPAGSHWLDPETAADQTANANWSNWEAIIDPASGPTFREFGIIYHEFGDEFENLRNRAGGALAMVEAVAFSYRPASRLLNYRSEPFQNRLNEAQTTDKASGYNSYTYGDPATPIPRSYLGEPTKMRLMHAGSDMLHVHHLHGGGDRWRANPGADNTDIAGGLEKVPVQNAKSIRLDSQTVGPDESYNAEIECGAGGCQQAAGDFLYHCHIAHHYIAGMWAFWRVFDTLHSGTAGGLNGDTPLAVIPGRPTPKTAVTSDQLLGTTVQLAEGARTVVLTVTNPDTEIALSTLVERQIPPKGATLDREDATSWNWSVDLTDPTKPVYKGEPEISTPMTNYTSPTPGQSPPILFNPTNGRYTWPLLRPHLGQRPPFAAQHSPTPWLGPKVTATSPDGLCPSAAPTKTYNITAFNTPLQEVDGASPETDPDGEIFVLSKDRASVTPATAKPLAIRSNVGDCVNISLSNDIDYINNLPSPQSAIDRNHKTNMHTHFVQFDPQGSDGVDTGFSFEQSIRFDGAELPSAIGDPDVVLTLRRTLTAAAAPGDTTIQVNSSERLRPGIAIAVGQGAALIEFRNVTATTPTSVTLDAPLANAHAAGETTGVEFARYQWYSDVDSGTVFWHDHVDGVHSWSRGLFGAHIIEPKGSDYLDPKTLTHVDSGDDVVIKPGSGALSPGVDLAAGRSFREYMIWLSNGRDTPQSRVATNRNFGQECEQGVINLHSEPFASRVPASLQVVEPNGGLCHDTIDTTDPNVFSSVKYGDPFTHLYRAYVGDPVVIRTLGLDERVEALRIQGHRFRRERFNTQGELMDAATTGISERFDYVLDGGAGGPKGKPGDYLYYTTRNFARADGGWGIFRVHDKLQTDLKPLPDRTAPATGAGFPQQTFTGGNPVHSNGVDNTTCVNSGTSAPVRNYKVAIFDKPLPVTETINGDRPLDANGLPLMHDRVNRLAEPDGIIYSLASDEGAIKAGSKPVEPLAIRANVGDCVRITLQNDIAAGTRVGGTNASIDLTKLPHDPQASGGSAVGFNPDSTVAQGATYTYTFMADKELGTSVFTNQGSPASQIHGAYGMLIVEPSGASWFNTNTGAALSSGAGTQVIIRSTVGNFREFALMPSSTDSQHDRSLVGAAGTTVGGRDAYEDDVVGFSYVNYHNEPLAPRLDPKLASFSDPTQTPLDPTGTPDHSVAYSSTVHGDPATELIFRTFAGDPVRWRVGVGASEQFHVFNVQGHMYPWEPNMTGSQLLTGRALAAGESQEGKLVRGAGGFFKASGDYLVRDGREQFERSGVWSLFRVLPTFSFSSASAVSDLAPVDG